MQEPLIAEIVLDVEARELRDRIFSYRIPEQMAGQIFIGAQVLVPFGHQNLVGGYVVSIESNKKFDFKLKDVAELVEPDPLFDREYIDFLHWLAFTTCSRLQDVIQAALPSCVAPRMKRVARLTDSILNSAEIAENESPFGNTLARCMATGDSATKAILEELKEKGAKGVSIPTLRRRVKKSRRISQDNFYRALNFLKAEGVCQIDIESTGSAGPKLIKEVQIGPEPPSTQRQKEIVKAIKTKGGSVSLPELLKAVHTTYGTINKMVEAGSLFLAESEVFRDPLKSFVMQGGEAEGGEGPELTDDQKHCMAVLEKELEESWTSTSDRSPEPWLLHGVTGSGKTEIYLRLIQKTLRAGKTAMLMVPEISLTPQLASRLKERFGDKVSIWHSAISDGERYDTWRRIKDGQVSVLLGARSAVLAHMPNLGLVVLDEEHDSSYKQTSPAPRYNAKDVAIEKARRQNAMVLLGSATPDVASYFKADKGNRIVELPNRVYNQAMPSVTIVDMRKELLNGNRSIFSKALDKELSEMLERKEQGILLLNRRGYASHVFCRACGYVAECKNCSVSLVFHQFGRTRWKSEPSEGPALPANKHYMTSRGYLACHHCGYERSALVICPSCESPFIKEFGLGTQRVEEFVRERFPTARLCRLDSDITSKKGAYRDVFEMFKRGDADILIGTQMVAKGLDVPNVTVVGVLVADASLNMPDYRSTERGFQLLSQVSGRAGRGYKPGKVILQTYNAELEVIKKAKTHDYESFYTSEVDARRAFLYPPFSRIIRLVISGSDLEEVQVECDLLLEDLNAFLEECYPDGRGQVLGPAPCLVERIKGRFRHHLLIKIAQNTVLQGQTSERDSEREGDPHGTLDDEKRFESTEKENPAQTIDRYSTSREARNSDDARPKQLSIETTTALANSHENLQNKVSLIEVPREENGADSTKPSPESLDPLLNFLRNKKTPKQITLAIDIDAIDLL